MSQLFLKHLVAKSHTTFGVLIGVLKSKRAFETGLVLLQERLETGEILLAARNPPLLSPLPGGDFFLAVTIAGG